MKTKLKEVNTLEEFQSLAFGTKVYNPTQNNIETYRCAGISPMGQSYILFVHSNNATSAHAEYRGVGHLKAPYYLDYDEACKVYYKKAKERLKDIKSIYITKKK